MRSLKLTPSLLLWVSILGLIATLCIEVITPLDMRLQDHFYDFQKQEWLVDASAKIPRFWFYKLPKIVLFSFGGILLLSAFGVKPIARLLPWTRRETFYLVVCMAGIPLLAGTGKNLTRVHCPSELIRYGGTEEYHRIISTDKSYNKIPPHCFPAGHASGGFALLALYFIRRKPLMLLPGLIYGWTMGLYQMFKGAHFLSHTLFTMFLATAVAAIVSYFFFGKETRSGKREISEETKLQPH